MVMRHAKSSWDDSQLDDHERQLNARGLRDAPRMAAWLLDQGRRPDSLTCSTAVRAETTARLVAEKVELPEPIRMTPELYHADLSAWRSVIRQLPEESNCALCVGHNPGIEMLFQKLTGTLESFPTAAICVLDLPIDDWPSFGRQKLLTTWTLGRPKEISDESADTD